MFTAEDGVRYHVDVAGRGEPLLLLHGFTGSLENWRPLLPSLTENFQVVTVDLLGHGRTDAPTHPQRYEMASAAADLVELMSSLGFDSFDLLGYSMGGRLALYLAVHYPPHVNRLILESASPGLRTAAEQQARRRFDHNLAAQIEADGLQKFVGYWESISLWESQAGLPTAEKARIRQIRLGHDPRGLANSLRGMGTGEQPSLWGDLANLSHPTLLITGELDRKFCEIGADMVHRLPNGRHFTVAQAGHTVHLEQPAKWIASVNHFLI